MKTKTSIIVKSRFVGFHQYTTAPDNVAFLRSRHRHVFGVRAQIEVKHDDRELEFFTVQTAMNAFLNQVYEGKSFRKSCEMMAAEVVEYLLHLYGERGLRVEVSEDDENSGVVETL